MLYRLSYLPVLSVNEENFSSYRRRVGWSIVGECDRSSEASQFERSDLGESKRLPPGEQTNDDAARENLTSVCPLTQPPTMPTGVPK